MSPPFQLILPDRLPADRCFVAGESIAEVTQGICHTDLFHGERAVLMVDVDRGRRWDDITKFAAEFLDQRSEEVAAIVETSLHLYPGLRALFHSMNVSPYFHAADANAFKLWKTDAFAGKSIISFHHHPSGQLGSQLRVVNQLFSEILYRMACKGPAAHVFVLPFSGQYNPVGGLPTETLIAAFERDAEFDFHGVYATGPVVVGSSSSSDSGDAGEASPEPELVSSPEPRNGSMLLRPLALVAVTALSCLAIPPISRAVRSADRAGQAAMGGPGQAAQFASLPTGDPVPAWTSVKIIRHSNDLFYKSEDCVTLVELDGGRRMFIDGFWGKVDDECKVPTHQLRLTQYGDPESFASSILGG